MLKEILAYRHVEGYRKATFRTLHAFDGLNDETTRTRAVEGIRFPCPHCPQIFDTQQGLHRHVGWRHEDRTKRMLVQVSNQCPWRNNIFACKGLWPHVQRREILGHCPRNTRHSQTALHAGHLFTCPRCHWTSTSLSAFHQHARTVWDQDRCEPVLPATQMDTELSPASSLASEHSTQHEAMGNARRTRRRTACTQRPAANLANSYLAAAQGARQNSVVATRDGNRPSDQRSALGTAHGAAGACAFFGGTAYGCAAGRQQACGESAGHCEARASIRG